MTNTAKTYTRVSSACKRCRSMKLKCTEKKPCSRCESHNIDCQYVKPDIDLNFTPTHYTRSQIENVVLSPSNGLLKKRKLSNRDTFQNDYRKHSTSSSDLIHPNEIEPPSNQALLQYVPFSASHKPQIRQGASLKCLDAVLLNLCYSNSGISNSNDFKIPRGQHYGWNMSGVAYIKTPPYPPLPSVNLDNHHLTLLNIFIEEVNSLYSILSRDFLDYLKISGPPQSINIEKLNSENTNKRVLLSALTHLIYAISIRHQEFCKIDSLDANFIDIEIICFEYAYQVLSSFSFSYTSVDIVRGWLLITLYLRMTNRQKSVQYALGQANLTAKAMGMNLKKINERLGSDEFSVFWSLYIFDNLYSVQLRVSVFWSHDQIKIPFPNTYTENYKRPGFSFISFVMLRISCLAHRVIVFREKIDPDFEIFEISNDLIELGDWLKNLDFNCLMLVKAQVMISFYDVVLTLHGPALLNLTGRFYPNLGLSLDIILDSLKETSKILNELKSINSLQSPCPMVLNMIFTLGSFSLAFMNGGIYVEDAESLYSNALSLAFYLNQFEDNINNHHLGRFRMAKEVVWALNQGHSSLMLRFDRQLKTLPSSSTPNTIDSSVNDSRFGDLLDRFSGQAKETRPPASNTGLSDLFDASLNENLQIHELDWMSALNNDWNVNL